MLRISFTTLLTIYCAETYFRMIQIHWGNLSGHSSICLESLSIMGKLFLLDTRKSFLLNTRKSFLIGMGTCEVE